MNAEKKIEEVENDDETSVKVEVKKVKGKKNSDEKYLKEISSLEEQVTELRNKYLRALADLDNYKKRSNEERINERKYASSGLIHDLLLPLDQLDIIVNLDQDNEMLKQYLIGFKMVNDQIYNMLYDDGLREIHALNLPFDPHYHHAFEKINNKDLPNGIVVAVTQKGYLYKEKLLRPAMVKVNEWSD